MLGQHGIKSAPPPSLPASPGVWSCSPMLSTIAARAAGPARPLWNRVAFMTLVLPRFGSSGRAGAVQSRCRRRVRAERSFSRRISGVAGATRSAAGGGGTGHEMRPRYPITVTGVVVGGGRCSRRSAVHPFRCFADRVGRPTRPVRRRTTQRCLRACRRVTISAVRCPRLGELLLVVIPETLIINRATSQGRFRPGDIAGRS